MSLRVKSLCYLALAALLWSSSGITIKSVEWAPLPLAAARGLMGAVTLALLCRRHLAWRRPSRGQGLAMLFYLLLTISFVVSTKLTTAANAILLQYTAPVWVALFAPVFLKESTRRLDWLFIGLTFGGMAVFFMDSLSLEGVRGIFTAIVSGMAYAGLAMVLRREPEERKAVSIVYGNLLLCLLGLLVWRPPWPPLSDLLLLAVAGIFQLGLPYYLFTLASRGVTALEMVLVTALEPILNPLWVFLGLGERPAPWSLAGGAVVLLAVTLWSVLKARDERGSGP
jgi:drug/metabolite transporter (DMT)-like permease